MPKPDMQPDMPEFATTPFSLCTPSDCCPSVFLNAEGAMVIQDAGDLIVINASQIPLLRRWMDAHKVGV